MSHLSSQRDWRKRNIAVVAGGYSGEKEVSLRSAKNIMQHIAKELFVPYLLIITSEEWYVQEGDKKYFVDKNDFSFICNGEKILFEYAYITIHGTPGENGLLQGYLDMLHIPYNTGGVLSEALTFDKYACNRYLSTLGVKVARSIRFSSFLTEELREEIAKLHFPCFVKPNAGGSSIATFRVNCVQDLEQVLPKVLEEAQEVLLEELIEGTEVTCGCLITKDKIEALPITEVELKDVEFFNYEAKYLGKSNEITPARISEEATQEIQELTKKIAAYVQAQGIIRVDYIISPKGEPTLLEVNTTPGMTDASFIPQQVRYAGRELADIFTTIIQDKLEN